MSIVQDRDMAYDIAQESIQLVEYILRGYNHQFPNSLYSNSNSMTTTRTEPEISVEEASDALLTMIDVIDRVQQEGEMYMALRHEAYAFHATTTNMGMNATTATTSDGHDDDDDSSSSSSSSSSSEEDGFLDDDEIDEEIEIGSSTFGEAEDLFSSIVQHKHEHEHELEEFHVVAAAEAGSVVALNRDVPGSPSYLNDFACPGMTMAMYDAILDAMACGTELLLLEGGVEKNRNEGTLFIRQLNPTYMYQIAESARETHILNNQTGSLSSPSVAKKVDWFPYTIPTMVTYNAALRGIGNLCLAGDNNTNKQQLVDECLACGFGLYNHLTHNDHGLPKRNAASIIYLLRIIKACLPPSRTRGNMTVTLWHQASREGIVTPDLIAAIEDVHSESNGPEFDVFLDALGNCLSPSASKDDKVIIVPQRFARFAKKYKHSRFY
jgi:hypothetical protein